MIFTPSSQRLFRVALLGAMVTPFLLVLVTLAVFCNPTLRVIAVGRRVIPRVVFTDPQIAVVGLTEQEGIAAGHDCWCNTLPMSLVPRAGAIRDARGIIKILLMNTQTKCWACQWWATAREK